MYLTMLGNPVYFWRALVLALFLAIGVILFRIKIFLVKYLKNDGKDIPRVFCKESTFTKFIFRKCGMMTRPFCPPWLARNRHVQTLLSHLFSRADVTFNREFLRVPDRGLIALDWALSSTRTLKKNSTVLMIIPGLTGDALTVSFLCQEAIKKGLRPVVFNRRGHGGSPLLSPNLPSLSDPDDLRHSIKYIRGRFPCTKIVAVGTSLGACLLMSYLGEYGSSSLVQAAVCISPLFDLRTTLTRPLHPLYEFLASYYMKKTILSHQQIMSKVIDIEAIVSCDTLREIERISQNIEAENIEEYWENNDPLKDVDEVAPPVLFVISEDDPLLPRETIPWDIFHTFPNMMLLQTQKGGHAAFLEDSNLEPWADKLSIEFLTTTLDFLHRVNRPRPEYSRTKHM